MKGITLQSYQRNEKKRQNPSETFLIRILFLSRLWFVTEEGCHFGAVYIYNYYKSEMQV